MNEQEKIKQVNQGYMLGLSTPVEFSKALSRQMKDNAKNSSEKERWKSLSEGFELGLTEQLKQRQQVLAKIKKGREKDVGRER